MIQDPGDLAQERLADLTYYHDRGYCICSDLNLPDFCEIGLAQQAEADLNRKRMNAYFSYTQIGAELEDLPF